MAFGFRIGKADSSPQENVKCVKLVGDSVRLGKGDPVKKVTGSVVVNGGPLCQAVARAASGDRVYGIVVGVEQHTISTGFNLDQNYSPASTAQYILVRPVRTGEIYEILEDAAGGSVATTDIGKNANFVAANCDTSTGMSGYVLDSSTAATTNTLDLRIEGFGPEADNVPGSTAVIRVSFNKVDAVDQATGV